MPKTSKPARRTRMSLGYLRVTGHGTAGHLQNIAHQCFSPCSPFLSLEGGSSSSFLWQVGRLRSRPQAGGGRPPCRRTGSFSSFASLLNVSFPAALLLPVLAPHLTCVWREEGDTSLQSTCLQVPLVPACPGTLWNRINLSVSL